MTKSQREEISKLPKNKLVDMIAKYDDAIMRASEDGQMDGWVPPCFHEFINNDYHLI